MTPLVSDTNPLGLARNPEGIHSLLELQTNPPQSWESPAYLLAFARSLRGQHASAIGALVLLQTLPVLQLCAVQADTSEIAGDKKL